MVRTERDRQPAEARAGPEDVFSTPPSFDDPLGHVQAAEAVLVQALVAEATVEALKQGFLQRLARRDKVPFHVALLPPGERRSAGQLCAVVADDDQKHAPRW